jgi:DNA-binding IclR family transcriptional regulator
MLEALFASKAAERVLLFLENYSEGNATAIARTFDCPLSGVQKQLQKFEQADLLVSRLAGKTRLYTWNPRFALGKPLRALLAEALRLQPREETRKYFRQRRRPRRAGKPL